MEGNMIPRPERGPRKGSTKPWLRAFPAWVLATLAVAALVIGVVAGAALPSSDNAARSAPTTVVRTVLAPGATSTFVATVTATATVTVTPAGTDSPTNAGTSSPVTDALPVAYVNKQLILANPGCSAYDSQIILFYPKVHNAQDADLADLNYHTQCPAPSLEVVGNAVMSNPDVASDATAADCQAKIASDLSGGSVVVKAGASVCVQQRSDTVDALGAQYIARVTVVRIDRNQNATVRVTALKLK